MIWSNPSPYYITSGEFSITKPGKPEFYPLPYTLYHRGIMIGSYPDVKAAIAKAREIDGDQ